MRNHALIVATKELRELLVTGRFQAAAALVFGLVAATLAVMTRSHARSLEEYGIAEAARLESLRQDGHLNRAMAWAAPEPPSALSILGGGPADAGMGWFHIDALSLAYPPATLIMVIGVVLSLVAVLFAHDAITGERERGTLRLLVSGAASRGSVLMGKLAGRFMALMIPLIAGLMAGSLVLALSRDVGWGISDTAVLVILTLVAMLFLAVFVALGLVVSAWTHTTHTSLATGLLVWAVFVLVVPSVAPYAAAALSPTGNLALHQRELLVIMDTERDALIEELQAEWQAPLLERHPEVRAYYELAPDQQAAAKAADPELDRVVARLSAIADTAIWAANQRQLEKRNRLDRDFGARSEAQIRLTSRLASASPYAAFVLAGLDLSERGPRAQARRKQQHLQWFESTYQPWVFTLADSLRTAHGSFDTNRRTDLSSMPAFAYASEPVPDRVRAMLPPLGSLTGFVALFMFLGLVGFRRYDVR